MDEKLLFVVAFFYEEGRGGNDFLYKENYKVPYKEEEMATIKKAINYIR